MTGKHEYFRVQCFQQLKGVLQDGEVSARQVRAADGSGKQRVAGKQYLDRKSVV